MQQSEVLQLRGRECLLLLRLLTMLVSLQLGLLSCSISVADVHGVHRMHACQSVLNQICVRVLLRIKRKVSLVELLRAVDHQAISKIGSSGLGTRDLGEDANSVALTRALLCLFPLEVAWHAGLPHLVVAVVILRRLEQILALLLMWNIKICSIWMQTSGRGVVSRFNSCWSLNSSAAVAIAAAFQMHEVR